MRWFWVMGDDDDDDGRVAAGKGGGNEVRQEMGSRRGSARHTASDTRKKVYARSNGIKTVHVKRDTY